MQFVQIQILDFGVNDCVVIDVLKFDRVPADLSNIINVILKKKNGLYKLGTKQGIIKGYGIKNMVAIA